MREENVTKKIFSGKVMGPDEDIRLIL